MSLYLIFLAQNFVIKDKFAEDVASIMFLVEERSLTIYL